MCGYMLCATGNIDLDFINVAIYIKLINILIIRKLRLHAEIHIILLCDWATLALTSGLQK